MAMKQFPLSSALFALSSNSTTPGIQYREVRNMGIRSYATNLNVPRYRVMRKKQQPAIMLVAAVVLLVGGVWWQSRTRGWRGQMFSRPFLACN